MTGLILSLILVGGPLFILTGCTIFLLSFLDVIRMSISVFVLAQRVPGSIYLENVFL